MRRFLPIAVAIICGLWVLADFFVSHPLIDSVGAKLLEGVMILAAFALFAGILNLLGFHARRISKDQKDWGYRLVLMVALGGTLIAGIVLPGSGALSWIFGYMYYPLQSTMAALLAFFVVSAAYRAFRLRNGEALIMLITSLVVLLAQLPFSNRISPYLPLLRKWILDVPVTAGTRGIILGTALGTITTSLRILLAVDHPYAQD
jgi:hypothetical protein